MLILSRKMGQEIVIGDNIRITIQRIGGSRVTVGIAAPDDVRIVRAELEDVVKTFDEPQGEVKGETAPKGWVPDAQVPLADLTRQLH